MQERFCRQHPAVEAVPALKSLLVDERFLNGIGIFRRAQPFEGDNFFSGCARDRQEAGTHRAVIQQDGAGPALSQAATEPRIVQGEIVSKDVEKRAISIGVHNVRLAVYFKRCVSHLDLDS